ncbi:MAG: acyl-coenzyme A synthetase/AMP-(fatty) acid ligase [Arenicella sp.]
MKSTALITRQLCDPIAYIGRPLKPLTDKPDVLSPQNAKLGIITAGEFIGHVTSLAAQLPNKRYCVNLCDNRYLFMVSVCAVIVAKQTNLLPANKSPATQERLAQDYPQSYLLHDGMAELALGIEDFDLNGVSISLNFDGVAQAEPCVIPLISLDHLAVISFTSGSTGDSQSNLKSWNTLSTSTAINSAYMLPNSDQTVYHLATVPSQHMWGFETTVLMAMFAKVCICDGRPLYPIDIYQELSKLPEPRALVSTPLHLRALAGSAAEGPNIEYILSATAPLDIQLAKSIESKLSTKIKEVYGCSEVGSMAIREPAITERWERFTGLNFTLNKENQVVVNAAHLPRDIALQDNIKLLEAPYFELQGRSSDLINIAGKRGSLHQVNRVMASFAGLLDGVVFFPEQSKAVPRLVAIAVLTQDSSLDLLRQHFKQQLDAAFVPRPIYLVKALPREDTGKLTNIKLLSLYQSLIKIS